jgi:hypothetical protein
MPIKLDVIGNKPRSGVEKVARRETSGQFDKMFAR